MDHELGGSVTSVLDHMKMYGLAAICENAGLRPVRLWWTNTRSPKPVLRLDATLEQVAETIVAHAQSVLDEGWMDQRFAQERAKDSVVMMLFAPRTAKIIETKDWGDYFAAREQHWPKDRLSSALVVALGEPHWHRVMAMKNASYQDNGASRWEMAPRNGGKDIMRHRFIQMAEYIVKRSVDQVVAELRGEVVIDDFAKKSKGVSFTATGLQDVGECDLVSAWLGLWGMVAVPAVRLSNTIAASPGMFPVSKNVPDMVRIPVWSKPTSLGVIRSVLGSDNLSHPGVAAFIECNIRLDDGGKASNRFILPGVVRSA